MVDLDSDTNDNYSEENLKLEKYLIEHDDSSFELDFHNEQIKEQHDLIDEKVIKEQNDLKEDNGSEI